MRNLKRALSLALAAMMLIGMMVVSAGAVEAKDFTDKDEIQHTEAVNTLVALNVISGKEDGSYFDPTGIVTRAEMAKMITIVLNGGREPNLGNKVTPSYTDIKGHWAEAYIEYCTSLGILSGRGNGKFDPNATITGSEAAKVVLIAMGYSAENSKFVGNSWEINVNATASSKGLYDGMSVVASAPLNRDNAALMVFNGLNATMVEYDYKLNTVDGNLVTVAIAKDRSPAVTLLNDKFGMIDFEGYLTDATYNKTTKKFTYTVDPDGLAVADDSDEVTVVSTVDFSALMGQKVRALYKVETDNTKTAYGIFSVSTTAEATVGQLELGTNTADKKVKLDGTEYTLANTEASTVVYTYANGTIAPNGDLADTRDPSSSIVLVDFDKDGKYDYAVVTPVSVAKVTYVGSKSITAGGVYTFEDNNIADGVAKNDFVKIVAAANSVYGKAEITKVDVVEGQVTALKNTSDVQIDGTWYKKVSGTVPSVGDTVKLAVVGGYYYDVETVDGKSVDNVLMVLDAGKLTSGLNSGAEAKVMYAKDGTVATVKVSKTDGTSVTSSSTVSTSATYGTAGHITIGAMYTFKEKDGALELTKLAPNVIGSYDFTSTGATFDKDGLNGNPAVGGKAIADDAVVMVYTTNNGGKATFTNGAALKTWKSDWGTAGQALSTKVNGIDTVKVVALYSGATIPGVSGSTSYGYVTGTTYYVEEDSTSYAVMDIWTANGQLTGVKAESAWDGTDSFDAPTAGTVSTLDAYKKGAFVTFENLSSGNIASVKAIGTADAITGMYTDKDGDTALKMVTDTDATITKDTVVVYVDTSAKTGAEGGELALAQETTISGKYVKNVVAYDKESDNDLEVIFVDVNNNLASNADTVTPATGTYIKKINLGTGTNELGIATSAIGTQVAGEAAGWTGAIAAQVIDNTGAVKTSGTVATTDTLRVVAEDGTVFTYVINNVSES